MRYVPGQGWVSSSILDDIPREALIIGGIAGGAVIVAGTYFYFTSGSTSKSLAVKRGLPGLHNLGNTCYANALLQGLASLPSMPRWLDQINTSVPELKDGFVHNLKEILLQLNEPSSCAYNAGGVVSSLSIHGWNITLGVEQDLFELLNVFVTTWDEELLMTRKRIAAPSLIDFDFSKIAIGSDSSPSTSSSIPNADEYHLDATPASSPIATLKHLVFQKCSETVSRDARIRAPCFGLTAMQLRCALGCGFKRVRYDSFGVLSVSIPKNSYGQKVTIEALLRKYFCMEIIREATCDNCKKNCGKTGSGLLKKQGFSKLPQCLIIRIERVGVLPSGMVFKLSDHIEFGETLDVKDFCFYKNNEKEYDRMQARKKEEERIPELTSKIVGGGELNESHRPLGNSLKLVGLAPQFATIDGGSFLAERRDSARYRYQLRAVSEHRGIPETGHFVTYRRGIEDSHSWYLTNDASVTKVPYSQVARSQAYMLYYERIQPSRWFKKQPY